MARPIEFDCVIESDDPRAEYERLLSAPPSPAALRSLRESDELDDTRLQLEPEVSRKTMRY